MHSLICLEAWANRLFEPVDCVFIVIAFIQRLLGSSMGGNDIVLPPLMWKLMRRKVHWPCTVSETLLIVLTWIGIQVVYEFGIRTAWRFMST